MTTDERFDRIDTVLERMSQHAERRFDALTRYVADFRSEVIRRLDIIENRLGDQGATVANVEARLPALTASIFDAGSFATNQAKETASLSARVAKLEEAMAKLLPAA